MQLKTIGESLSALNNISKITDRLTGNTITYSQAISVLKDVSKNYSTEAIKAELSQSGLNSTQIKSILSTKNLKGETLNTATAEVIQAQAANALKKAQDNANTSTTGFSYAVKGLGDSLKKAIVAHPTIAGIALVTTAIFAATKAYNTFSESAKKAREIEENRNRLNSSVEELQEANSRLEQVNSELEITKTRIQELLKLESPTLVDKQELADLQKKNSLLLQQQQVLKASQSQQSKEVAENTSAVLNESRDRQQYEINSGTKKVEKLTVHKGFEGKQFSGTFKKISINGEIDSDKKTQIEPLISQYNQMVDMETDAAGKGDAERFNLVRGLAMVKFQEIKNILGEGVNTSGVVEKLGNITDKDKVGSNPDYNEEAAEMDNKEYIKSQIERYNVATDLYKNTFLNGDASSAELIKEQMNQIASDQLTWMGELSEEAKGYLNDDGSIKQGYEEEYNE